MKHSILTLGAAFALASVSQAAYISDTFEGYTNGDDMNGLGGWVVTNGASGSGPIAIATDYTFNGSNGAALIGGFTPNGPGTTVSLSQTVSIDLKNVGAPDTFSMQFGFLDSLNAFRNPYSIVLNSTSGNLLTVSLTAGSPNQYDVSFSSAFFTGVVNWGTLDSLETAGSPYTQIQFDTWFDGTNVNYSLTTFGNPMSSGTLTGIGTSESITGLSINVDTAGGAGDGFLVIDNVTLIPEPSSALMGLLGAAFAFTRRRRA